MDPRSSKQRLVEASALPDAGIEVWDKKSKMRLHFGAVNQLEVGAEAEVEAEEHACFLVRTLTMRLSQICS